MQYKILKAPLQTRSINHDFVLASLNSDGKDLPYLFVEHKEILDWDWMFAFSQRHKISGIFVNSLEKFGIVDRLPREIQNQIDLIKSRAQQRAARANFTLKQLHEALTKEDIPFLVLKGNVFIYDLYEKPAIRPYHDIDLLVSPQLLTKAEDVLISLGYKFYCPPIRDFEFLPLGRTPKSRDGTYFAPPVAREIYRRFHNHFPYVLSREDERLPIDLHWQLFRPKVLKTGLDPIWNYTRGIKINNLIFMTLDLETSLLYLATKIAINGPEDFSLSQVYDFHRYLRVFDNNSNLRRLEKSAYERGVKNYLAFSLRLTKKLFNFDITRVLDRNSKGNIYSYSCFFIAASKSLLISPRREGALGFLKMNICSLFWDLGMFRMPRRAIRILVRTIIRFLQKKFY